MLSKNDLESYKRQYRIGDKISFDTVDANIDSMVGYSHEELNRFQGEWTILGYKQDGVICQYLIEDIGHPTYIPFVALLFIGQRNKLIDIEVTLENIEERTLYIYEREILQLKEKDSDAKSVLMYKAINKFYGDENAIKYINKDINKFIKLGY